MNNKSKTIMNIKVLVGNLISWLIGFAILAIGAVNIFWGNDPGFGAFLLLLALIYFPPVTAILKSRFGFSIRLGVKILLALFIVWAALGVGELFDKIDMMMKDLKHLI